MAAKRTEFSKFNPALAMLSRPEDVKKSEDIDDVAADKPVELKIAEGKNNTTNDMQERKNIIEKEDNNIVKEENIATEKKIKKSKNNKPAESLKSFSFKLNNEDYTLMRFVCGLNGISMNEYIVKLIRADMENYTKYISAVKEINPELFE